jgi:hypothetical protein
MTISFVSTQIRGYRRVRASENKNNEAQPRYLLLVTILLACLGGFLLGRQESTPATMTTVLGRLSEIIGGDPELSVDYLLGQLAKTRLELEDTFRTEYGEFYGALYDPIQVNKHIFLASPMSRDRLKRRLMQKIVQKLVDPTKNVEFIWATSGDSSAAAHGNMFNQSYTAVLETSVQSAFQALGMTFVGRNYAMSWYQSAPELALCLEEVYGADLDVLNWDFAMQDGDAYAYKTEMWAERAAMHPALPVLFFVDSRASQRLEMLQQKLESNGVGFVFMDKMAVDVVRSRVPPTSSGRAVKDWICPGGAVEGSLPCDDPIRFFMCEQRDTAQECLAAKYNTLTGCDSGRKSNHPGWKEQQFKGMLMGHFMLDLLEEALITLDAMKHPNGQESAVRSQIILDRLNAMHQLDMQNATRAPIPPSYAGVDQELMTHLTPSLLFRGNSVCHTALLPAQSRFLDHVTESGMIGTPDGDYDKGQNKVLCVAKKNQLPLAYESADRVRMCASPKIDHKDFFYLRNQDGWLYSTVPTHAEIQAYQRNPPQGIIIICLKVCPMDRCSDDYVGLTGQSSAHGDATVDIRVDGRDVKNILNLDHHCHILENESGIRWGPGKAGDGRYKISLRLSVKMKGLGYSVKISSIVVM